MKALKRYINTMYSPSFYVLCIGLALFSILFGVIAINLRQEQLIGEINAAIKYPRMIEQAIFPLYILLPITICVDLNERKKKS